MKHNETYYLFYSPVAAEKGVESRHVVHSGVHIEFNFWGYQDYQAFEQGEKPTVNNCKEFLPPEDADSYKLKGNIDIVNFRAQNFGKPLVQIS